MGDPSTAQIVGVVGALLLVVGISLLAFGNSRRDKRPRVRVMGRVVRHDWRVVAMSRILVEYPLPDGSPHRVWQPVVFTHRPWNVGARYPVWVLLADPRDAVVARAGATGSLAMIFGGVLVTIACVAFGIAFVIGVFEAALPQQ